MRPLLAQQEWRASSLTVRQSARSPVLRVLLGPSERVRPVQPSQGRHWRQGHGHFALSAEWAESWLALMGDGAKDAPALDVDLAVVVGMARLNRRRVRREGECRALAPHLTTSARCCKHLPRATYSAHLF